MSLKRWRIPEADKARAKEIAAQLELDEFLVLLLAGRGHDTPEKISEFLDGDETLSDPFLIRDMDKAVSRIRAAVDDFEPVAVFGDYDADGITATALLYSYLETCGANVTFYIPEREGEGYGMSERAVDALKERGVSLIVTVDNGISAVQEVAYAKTLGIDVVVTDHHRPGEALPGACAVVDPHRIDCGSPFKEFAGVGVAFKLICALEAEEGDADTVLDNFSELVAIGTVADIVPLTGENRTLVRHGLRQMAHTDRPGLRALIEESGLDIRNMTATDVAFGIAPRMNATGRMGSPVRSVKLLLAEDADEAAALAAELCEENRNRQGVEQEISVHIGRYFEGNPARLYDRVLVVDGENFHPGVIGIVAARLLEKHGKPVIVISRQGEEAKGSGRSLPGFSLFAAMTACADYFDKFGGHEQAGGFTMRSARVEDFRRAINDYAAQRVMPMPELCLDLKLNPKGLTPALAAQLSALEPFGCGNETPLFALLSMTLKGIYPVGGGKHLRLTAERDGAGVTIMRFGVRAEQFPFAPGDVLDFAVTLSTSVYRGQEQLSVVARDIRPSGLPAEEYFSQRQVYERFHRGETLSGGEAQELWPARTENAALYRFLREQKGFAFGADILCHRLSAYDIGYGKLCVALDAMEEKGLLQRRGAADTQNILLTQVDGKVDLESSERYELLRKWMGAKLS